MFHRYTNKKMIRVAVLLFGICGGLTHTGISQSFINSREPVTIVKPADRISLYPSNGHDADATNFVFPNVVRKNGIITVFASRQFEIIELISGNGTLLLQENIKGRTGRFDVPLKTGAAGINYIRLRNKETMIIQKLIVTE